MAIPSVNNPAVNMSNTQGSGNTLVAAPGNNITAKQQLNSQLVQNIPVSLSSGQKPLSLVYSAAIDNINKILSQSLGGGTQDVLQKQMDQDNSPEATADRILSGSLGFFGMFAKQNPNMSEEEQAKKFVNIIRGGFERGFKEASDILKSLNVLNGGVATDIQKTYDLVQKGYDDFVAKYQKQSDDGVQTKPAPK